MKKLMLLGFCLLLNCGFLCSQDLCTVNGYDLSTNGDLKILFIFAELDCSSCPASGPLSAPNICNFGNSWENFELDEWPRGELPLRADDWVDYDATVAPSRYISKYINDVSFGALNVTGDYYPEVLTVDCDKLAGTGGSSQVGAVLSQLTEEYNNSNPDFVTTARGMFSLDDFDQLSNERGRGEVKPQVSNNEIDAICIMWRNNKSTKDYAFQSMGGGTILTDPDSSLPNPDFEVFLASSWKSQTGDNFDLFIAEIFHPMYGGNNWHTAGGKGAHTFPFNPSNTSFTTQNPGASQSICGWDRLMMGWTSPVFNENSVEIPVANSTGEIVSGDLSVETLPAGVTEQVFVLRDHFTTGDALRIRLPHISGSVKNQYLWIENRQLISEFDVQKDDGDCQDKWVSGLYPYIQVGKDVQCANSEDDLYASTPASNANSLGSYLFPLSAEGSYDYHYQVDQADFQQGIPCVLDYYIPKEIDHANTLPNPFTGASDLYKTSFDSNGDGAIGKDHLDDPYDLGNAEVTGGVLNFTSSYHGDSEDAFRLSGNSKLGIGTNPAATPVYTRKTGPEHGEEYTALVLGNYENRTIWLNGISVEIIESIPNTAILNADGTPSSNLKVRVKWNDYIVEQNNRWCGDIVLQDDPNDSWESALVVNENLEILLDQGRTPTGYDSYTTQIPHIFADKTTLTIGENTSLHLKESARLRVKNNSTLVIEEGADILLEDHACIIVEETGTLYLKGNNIDLKGSGAVIILKGTLKTDENVDFTFTGPGYIDVHPSHQIDMGANSNFVIERPITSDQKRFMRIRDNTVLDLSDRELRLRYGKVIYGDAASIAVSDGGIVSVGTIFEGYNNTNVGLRGTNLDNCQINFNEFYLMSRAIELSGNNTIPILKNNLLDDNWNGILAQQMDQIILRENQITNFVVEAVRLEEIDDAEIAGNVINGTLSLGYEGLVLNDVNAAWVGTTFIQGCQSNGIRAHQSNVLLSGGTTIENNQNGVFFENNATAEWALSVGTCSCANIINNDTGVKGDNLVLHIDAIENQTTCNSANPMPPNRFDGNTYVFDICYSDPLYPGTTAILMRGNYWGAQSLSATGNYKIRANGCATPSSGPSIDDSDAVTDINLVSNCSIVQVPTPGSSKYPKTESVCEVIEAGATIQVHEQARLAFDDFYNKDNVAALSGYQPVSNLDPLMHNSPSCVHKINFARCIVEALQNDQYATPYTSGWHKEAIQRTDKTDLVRIAPNPATTHIDLLAPVDQNYSLVVYDIMGRIVYAESFMANLQVSVGDWERGLYLFAISDESGKRIQVTKLNLVITN